MKWKINSERQSRIFDQIEVANTYAKSLKIILKLMELSNSLLLHTHHNTMAQEVNGRAIDLEEIQDEDTSHSEITSKIPIEVEGFEPPQEEVISICMSERTHRASNRLCLSVEVEEHSLGDLNEPTSYKAKMVDYEETFSPVDDIRAIRILISIAAYYDYEIWQMDVKNAFLNGYLDEDIYMDLEEAAFILGIKIYRDRSKQLFGLGQNAYMEKILKRYQMDNSKRGHIPMQERLLNKTQGASTPKEVKRMQNVPYASAVVPLSQCFALELVGQSRLVSIEDFKQYAKTIIAYKDTSQFRTALIKKVDIWFQKEEEEPKKNE
nr:zinc finger, CCHC-type [Tanacetum cinerariifolium]